MKTIYIVSSQSRGGRKLHTLRIKILFKFNSTNAGVDEIEWIKRSFQCLVKQMKKETGSDNDQLGFTFTSLNYKNRSQDTLLFARFRTSLPMFYGLFSAD